MEFVDKKRALIVIVSLLIVFLVIALVTSYYDEIAVSETQNGFSSNRSERPLYSEGYQKTFTVTNFSRGGEYRIEAINQKVGEYSYIFVQRNVHLPTEVIDAVSKVFDEEIYPNHKTLLGPRHSLGVNADYRVTILFVDKSMAYLGKSRREIVKGFYWPINEFPSLLDLRSSESKVIYIFYDHEDDLDNVLETVRHESEHLAHWGVTKNNIGLVFIGALFGVTLFTIYLGLSHLYLVFLPTKR